ncbi:related to DPP1-diacylglycerol pyrophosphate phosphatase [Serendipita indica DSM 11827]|uniref:Related to DPP1-diacylglycerol pyrophosphate phosphatase n=1 Tax=Serendipita indica (strain DSM 11827) TaxID=1109443 RepID=G4TI76_SERID|nr:related to DPP1-diacylglycerol pyrophosphate phosphatase [Serendipita indica DSM 11827]
MDFSWLDRSYLIDWILVVVWYSLSNIFIYVPVFERDIPPQDAAIGHTHRPNQVNGAMLHLLSDGIPIAVVLIMALTRRSLIELHHGLLAFFSSTSLQRLVVGFLKNRVGRLRPDFLDRCQWNGRYCTGDTSLIRDGRRSFPSGHSSAAFAGMAFLFFYFADKTDCFRKRPQFAPRSWRSSVLLRVSITISPLFLSTWIAVTRLEDYRHHKEDVIVGSLIGTLSSWLMYRVYFQDPFSTSREPAGEPRAVYTSAWSQHGQDEFMELNQLEEQVRLQDSTADTRV